ncbi:MAG: 50S ribosomal protein L9 [Candidatus Pacebacteria bacterium]|nr:50S ribosomal protein L9 [Candidatus Paceibacterota bacterium]MCF7857120.1 50S ribosomal protein L9 [Candidatus Paceibacterota bacterium]
MKVILTKDVARLGKRSEVKEVPSGHALNFLIPRKLAVIATPENMKRLSQVVLKQNELKHNNEQAFEETVSALREKLVEYKIEANDQGHLFKGVSAENIATYLQEIGHQVTKTQIQLEHPIKEIGQHDIPLVFGKIQGVCHLVIVKK